MIITASDITIGAPGSEHVLCKTGDAGQGIHVGLPDPLLAVGSVYTITNAGSPSPQYPVTIQWPGGTDLVLPADGFGITLLAIAEGSMATYVGTAIMLHPDKLAAIAAL